MKKEYNKPESIIYDLRYEEIMDATSEVQMEGTTESFDSKKFTPFEDDNKTDELWQFDNIEF